MSGSAVHPTTASSSILVCAAMQPVSGSAERPADQSNPERTGEQSDSSAVQPAQLAARLLAPPPQTQQTSISTAQPAALDHWTSPASAAAAIPLGGAGH